MADAVEKLKALLEKKNRLYTSLESQIQHLQSEHRELASEICGVEQALREIQDVSPNGSSQAIAKGTPPLPAIGKYAGMNPTPAILDVIQVHGSAPGLLVPEIISKLKAEGFKSDAKELYSVVYQIAQRLVKKDKIRETKKDGKRAFVRKQPF